MLLHLRPNVITFRTLLHLGPNVITFRTLLHLGQLLHLGLQQPQQNSKCQLLMRASRDGFQAQTFHSKCDNKGPTVTIVKSGNNIFGGFTETSWSSKCIN